ncbi:hypothetical protein BBO99_00001803 [Phytophthora kernoviae]|uniref:EFHB C-terminal EF-hand domain-containing protein n=2 Tax=Phytophthora kernoviae TaxID=325452 RepID=A0A3R7K778_9STRA|nr:hypothetical protein G195_002563 [Phytophthora kernoviae 00238/432]KAG2527578.1 hypothetical protein JM16_003346 [Phytophthora kernoviae]KAG2532079.1 hypothetical protein JM18_001428 [Phytophthora kernoviae]RLN27182.1 hypothetical protein BBI17_001574 [Phytophthora kernoviae]RLN83798.1 hypothetical protein BBO99_00001803 [Phytophthora kernoviae]
MSRRQTPPRPAGKISEPQRDTTGLCLTFGQRPGTPEEIRRYRKSYFSEPGARIAHPGLVDDLKRIDPMTKFGIVTTGSEHVPEMLVSGPATEYQRINLAKLETNYASHKREPLGKTYSRGHVLPAHMQKPEFAFGMSGTFCESAKELLYPSTTAGLLNSQQDEELYRRSHGSVAPGEQKNRGYGWEAAKINPAKHRFGVKPIGNTGGEVAVIMNPEMDESAIPPAVASHNLENKRTLYDHLGKPRHLGAAETDNLPNTRVFGVTTQNSDSAWLCIQGEYSSEEQQPDANLGRAVNHGWRNATADTRAFGIPTIRSDIPAPARRSVADGQNYGDDANAHALLYPEEFASSGVANAEFAQPRDQKYLRGLFGQIGHGVDDDDFELVWKQATQSVRYTRAGEASIADYRDALNDFLEAQGRGPAALQQWQSRVQAM